MEDEGVSKKNLKNNRCIMYDCKLLPRCKNSKTKEWKKSKVDILGEVK